MDLATAPDAGEPAYPFDTVSPETPPQPPRPGLLKELQRRRVFRVTGTYVLVAWIMMQAGEIVFPAFELPNRALRWLILSLVAGLPVVVLAAWWIDVTPSGIRLTARVDRALGERDRAGEDEGPFGRSLEILLLGVGLPLVAFGVLLALLLGIPEDSVRENSRPRAVAKVEGPALAVLPFEDSSNAGGDSGFFARGMHEDILTHLSRIDRLKLISRTSVLTYEGTTLPIRQIGHELGVTHILEGSVRRTATHVRVTAQLIHAETDEHVWANHFDAELSNVFQVQSEIASAIATALERRFPLATATDTAPAVSPAAYDAYAKARDLHRNLDTGDRPKLQRARHLYEEARRLDPSFAAAWLHLGILEAEAVWFGFDTSSDRPKRARAAIDQANSLGIKRDQLALAEGILAYYLDRDYGKALLLFEEASALAGGNADARFYRALVLRRLGEVDTALQAQQEAIRLDPLNLAYQDELAYSLMLTGDLEAADFVLRELLAKDPNRTRARLQSLQLQIEREGRPADAFETLQQRDNTPNPTPGDQLLFFAAGLSNNATDARIRFVEKDARVDDHGELALQIALLSQLEGQPAATTYWLEQANSRFAIRMQGVATGEWSDFERRLEGLLLAEQGAYDDALRVFQERVEKLPIEQDLITGIAPLWDLLVLQLRASQIDAALESFDRLSHRVAIGGIPFGGFYYLEHWPQLESSRADPKWRATLEEHKPAYAEHWQQ